MTFQHLFEFVRLDSIFVEGNGHEAGLVGSEGLYRPQVGGPLGEDDVARIDEHLADQVEGLLGAVDDEDVFLFGGYAVLLHLLHQVLLEGRVALGGAVLKSPRPVVGQDVLAGFSELPDQE